MSSSTKSPLKSNLELINDCDSFPYFYPNPSYFVQRLQTYYHLRVAAYPDITLGYLLPSVALTLANLPDWDVDPPDPTLYSTEGGSNPTRTVTVVSGTNEQERSAIVAKTCAAMRQTGHWKVLSKWRDELYPVYGPRREILFTIERSASPLFGVVTYGVHMTAYCHTPEGELRIWVPRRSRNKQTYPSMLDNTVAGGIAVGEQPLECLIRECDEEASLGEDVVRRNIRPVGCVTYFYIRDERAGGETGLLQPECQYVHDLDLSNEKDVVCKPNDEEVEGFEIMSVEQVKEALARSEFKPNCALVILDFLIRHGVYNKENEPDYEEIMCRLHRRLEFPMG